MLRVEEHDDGSGKYFLNGARLLRVSEVLNLAGLSPSFWFDEATRRLAAQRGTAVHRAADLIDDDRLDWGTIDPLIEGFVRAYQAFRDEGGFRFTSREETVYHPEFGFAGTLDRVGYKNDLSFVVDLKTSQTIEPWVGLQLAGYVLASHRFDDVALHREQFHRVAIQLRPDGTWRRVDFDDPGDLETFRAAVYVARWKQRCVA